MEAHARSAAQASTKLDWGLLFVKCVHLIPPIYQVTPHVSAKLGSQDQMQATAYSVSRVPINHHLDPLCVLRVEQANIL